MEGRKNGKERGAATRVEDLTSLSPARFLPGPPMVRRSRHYGMVGAAVVERGLCYTLWRGSHPRQVSCLFLRRRPLDTTLFLTRPSSSPFTGSTPSGMFEPPSSRITFSLLSRSTLSDLPTPSRSLALTPTESTKSVSTRPASSFRCSHL